ncbi:hypothetical protein vseg_006000 [Gypsophila vaccaria]
MQRQSLGGSPSRERLTTTSATDTATVSIYDDYKRRESSSASFSAADFAAVASAAADELKPEKPRRCSSLPEKFIHFIPILLVFSFFVLYLSSHDPSPYDLAQFRGFNRKHTEQIIEINDDDNYDDVIDTKNKKALTRSNAFVIRSLKEEIIDDGADIIRSHRKFGDF